MTRLKWLISILCGTFVYVILSTAYGQNGVDAYRQLQEQKNEISLHTSEIQKINDELFLEYNALLNDKDVIAAYARKLDYILQGEKLVKITGLAPVENKIYDTGSILKHKDIVYVPETVCKGAGFCVFLAVALIFIVLSFIQNTNTSPVTVKSHKDTENDSLFSYDLQQI